MLLHKSCPAGELFFSEDAKSRGRGTRGAAPRIPSCRTAKASPCAVVVQTAKLKALVGARAPRRIPGSCLCSTDRRRGLGPRLFGRFQRSAWGRQRSASAKFLGSVLLGRAFCLNVLLQQKVFARARHHAATKKLKQNHETQNVLETNYWSVSRIRRNSAFCLNVLLQQISARTCPPPCHFFLKKTTKQNHCRRETTKQNHCRRKSRGAMDKWLSTKLLELRRPLGTIESPQRSASS